MKAKKLLLILIILLMAGSAHALTITQNNSTIALDADGIAQINENFSLRFDSAMELDDFKQRIGSIGPDFIGWQVYNENFVPHFGSARDIFIQKKISFNETERVFTMSYQIKTPITEKTEKNTETIYTIKQAAFENFIQEGSFRIQKGTDISIQLPPNSALLETSPPSAIIGNEIAWNGFLSSNQFKVSYSIKKPIAPQVSVVEVLQSFFSKQENLFIVIIAIFIIIALYVKRKPINNKIEEFVVQHSEIKSYSKEE